MTPTSAQAKAKVRWSEEEVETIVQQVALLRLDPNYMNCGLTPLVAAAQMVLPEDRRRPIASYAQVDPEFEARVAAHLKSLMNRPPEVKVVEKEVPKVAPRVQAFEAVVNRPAVKGIADGYTKVFEARDLLVKGEPGPAAARHVSATPTIDTGFVVPTTTELRAGGGWRATAPAGPVRNPTPTVAGLSYRSSRSASTYWATPSSLLPAGAISLAAAWTHGWPLGIATECPAASIMLRSLVASPKTSTSAQSMPNLSSTTSEPRPTVRVERSAKITLAVPSALVRMRWFSTRSVPIISTADPP